MIVIPGLYKSIKTDNHWRTLSIENGRLKMIQMVESAVPVECTVGDFEKAVETKQMILNQGLTSLLQYAADVKPKKK